MNSIPPAAAPQPQSPQSQPPQMQVPQPVPPQAPAPPPMYTAPAMPAPRPPSDAPSPIGLIVAGVGLFLLCVSVLVPRINVEGANSEDASFYGVWGLFGGANVYAIDTPTVVLSAALLAAVGFSAHRNPAFRWPARLSAVGLAAFTAAYAYHPVTVLRQLIEAEEESASNSTDEYADEYEDYEEAPASTDIDVSADSGVYIAFLAVALLALSAFLMQFQRRQQYVMMTPYQAPPPAAGPGTNPAVSVNPG